MAQSNHVGSVSRHHTPAQGLQLSDGDAPNLEEVDVTQDATQRRSTPDRADADASEDDSNSDVASTQRSTQIKDETQNTQAMNRDASDEHVPDNESEAEDGNDDRVNSQVHEEPSEDAQDRPSERALALRELSWEDLQQRFQDEMAKKTGEEEALKQEFQQYTELYLDWASMPAIKEEERAAKRLRTRIAHVQHEESDLEAKEQHLNKVRAAFQQAIVMLTGG